MDLSFSPRPKYGPYEEFVGKRYRGWRRTVPPYPLHITETFEDFPDELGPHEVLIRIHAISLNYRDIAMLREGGYPAGVEAGGIPGSDCAAEVMAVGSDVKDVEPGDRVAPTFDLLHLTGDEREMKMLALGGDGPGVLREYAIFEENVLVKLPEHLSFEEASTLTCAGVTAWTALDSLKNVKEDTTVLVQGTGGVSIFGLLICLTAGIKVIVTSSSDDKLQNLKELGDVQTVNYKTQNVAEEVLRLTQDKGVDYIINNVGLKSLPEDLKMLRRYGTISLVGFLGGFDCDFSGNELWPILYKTAKVQGIGVGSKLDFEALNKFIEGEKMGLDKVIDNVYVFDNTLAAFERLASGEHAGKVVIKLG